MIAALVTAILLARQTPTPAPAPAMPKANTLISKMFKRYADAKTVSGKISMTQSSMGKTYQVETQVVFERPDLIRVFQTNPGPGKPPTELVSDGIQFSYTSLQGPVSPPKMLESVHPKNHPALKIGDMYYCIQPTMADRSMPLDVAVGRIDDLKLVAAELASFDLKGSTSVRGIPVYQIEGQWRDTAVNQITGKFVLFVTPEGDCLRFERHHLVSVSPKWLMDHKMPADAYQGGVPVDTVWESSLVIDQPVNRSVFNLHS